MTGRDEQIGDPGEDLRENDEPREPWQEAGHRCRFTESGICVANAAVGCMFPRCSLYGGGII